MHAFAGFIYSDWVDKPRPLNGSTPTVKIDPTKYFITSSAQRNGGPYRRAESSPSVGYHDQENSAHLPAHNSSRPDEASYRLHCSDTNVATPYDNSSSHLVADGRDLSVGVPPARSQRTQSTQTDIELSELNLTNSMTSMIQSGSTTSAWSSVTSPVPPEARKPPSGRQGKMAKRATRRLEADDPQNRLLLRPASADVTVPSPDSTSIKPAESSADARLNQQSTSSPMFSPPEQRITSTPVASRPPKIGLLRRLGSLTSRKKTTGMPADVRLHQHRSASSSTFFPPHDNEEERPTVTPRLSTKGLLRRPMSVAVIERPVHDASARDDRCQVCLTLSNPPAGADAGAKGSPSTTSDSAIPPRHKPLPQEPRRWVSRADVKSSCSPSSATAGSQDYQNAEPNLRSQPRPLINTIGKQQKALQHGKAASLAEVTSGPQISNYTRLYAISEGTVWYRRDVTAMGVACSHDSLSDEGYQTKDSGSSSSLNRTHSTGRGCNVRFSTYL